MKPLIEQFSREQLELMVVTDHAQCGDVAALAQIALAVMDAKPIAFTEKHEISNMEATGLYLRAWPTDRPRNETEGYTIGLYTTPPAASVPDNQAAVYAAAQKLVKCKGRYHAELNYKALAELFGVKTHEVAEPEPNYPVIPEGWKLVPLVAFPSQWAAGQKAFDAAGINKIDPVYKAMVAAAPAPGGDREATPSSDG